MVLGIRIHNNVSSRAIEGLRRFARLTNRLNGTIGMSLQLKETSRGFGREPGSLDR